MDNVTIWEIDRDILGQLFNWSGIFYFPDREEMEVVMKLKSFFFAVVVTSLCVATNGQASLS